MPVPVAPQMSGGTPGVLPRNPAGHTWSTAASSPKEGGKISVWGQ